ncbi:ferredoxin [Streptomyces sp. NPDC091212]|uniref:ferredoxin n=1 Tax=Streptomyces sp. NPDC091212 TaxID=3155191 RepID=UPI00342F8B8F
MRITVDTDRCVGAGQCVLSAPDVFDQDDDGLVTLVGADSGDFTDQDAVRKAGDLCPAQAIAVHEG